MILQYKSAAVAVAVHWMLGTGSRGEYLRERLKKTRTTKSKEVTSFPQSISLLMLGSRQSYGQLVLFYISKN